MLNEKLDIPYLWQLCQYHKIFFSIARNPFCEQDRHIFKSFLPTIVELLL